MGVVIEALFGLLIIAIVIWLCVTNAAASADRRERDLADAEVAQRARRDERDRRMRSEAIALHCAACDTTFPGPLTPEGCPRCRSAALVVPEDEYRRLRQRSEFTDSINSEDSARIASGGE